VKKDPKEQQDDEDDKSEKRFGLGTFRWMLHEVQAARTAGAKEAVKITEVAGKEQRTWMRWVVPIVVLVLVGALALAGVHTLVDLPGGGHIVAGPGTQSSPAAEEKKKP